jgi:predicted anti-sigma-YlaC factor YlaD
VNCEAVTRELSNYIDNDIDAHLRAELDEHLSSCTHCTVVLSQIRHTVEVFCDAEPVDLPADTRQRLYDALQKKLNASL